MLAFTTCAWKRASNADEMDLLKYHSRRAHRKSISSGAVKEILLTNGKPPP